MLCKPARKHPLSYAVWGSGVFVAVVVVVVFVFMRFFCSHFYHCTETETETECDVQAGFPLLGTHPQCFMQIADIKQN